MSIIHQIAHQMNVFQSIVQSILNLLRSNQARQNTKPASPKPKASPPSPPATEPVAAAQEKPAAVAEAPPKPKVEEPLKPLPLEIKEVKSTGKTFLVVSDGKVEARFRPHKKGLFTYGNHTAVDFIKEQHEMLDELTLSESAINVMQPVSDNEGRLDAINTWDDSFLTFGMFQWTIGARENAGELPALLRKIKEKDADRFQRYFGVHGLDVSQDTSSVYGFLTLDGTPVKARTHKEQFRSPEWAFRFWKAGQDPVVQAVEIEHAISRLKTFYWKNKFSIEGHPISEIITSEYGVALILDNHVNRPGYVDNCLRLAVKKANPGDPSGWTSEDEARVIDAYVGIRKTYGKNPMTHADKRANVTKRYVKEGILSAERGSFLYDPGMGSRSLNPADLIGTPPADYSEEQYEDIVHYDRQVEEIEKE